MASAWDAPAKAAGNTVLSADYNSLVKYVKPFQSNGLYYGTPMSDHDYYGTYTDGKSGEAITVMQVVYLKQSDNKWYKAKADYTSTLTGMLGLAVSAAGGADTQFTVLLYGIYRDDDFTAFTAGTDVYVSAATAGSVTQTLGTSATILVRRIGYAQAAQVLVFDPEPNIHTEVLHTALCFGSLSSPTTVLSKDNGGYERFFFKDDFSNNTIAAYTKTGTPTIASGVLTMAYDDKIIKALPSTGASTGKWDIVAQFGTSYAATVQHIQLFCGTNTILAIKRKAADAIWLQLLVNGAACIAETNTTVTLADSTDGRASVTYDGTNWQMYWNGVAVGAATAGAAPTTPSIGVLDTADAGITLVVTVNEITYAPGIAYTDSFASDSSARYQQVTGTVAFSTDHVNLTTGNVAGNYVRERLKYYKFGKGNRLKKIKLPAACVAGDYVNIKMCATGDLLLGYGLGVIRQADATWHICTVKDVAVTDTTIEVAGLADGDYCYIETDWDADRGVYYGYVYEATKPTSPQVTIFDSTYNHGFTGIVGYTAENVAKEFQLWSVVIRSNLLIARTNIPATETGFYLNTSFDLEESGRWTKFYGTGCTITYGGAGVLSLVGGTTGAQMVFLSPSKFGSATYYFSATQNDSTSTSRNLSFLIYSDGRYVSTSPDNSYVVNLVYATNQISISKYVAGSGSTLAAFSYTLTEGVEYQLMVVHSSPNFSVYVYSGGSYVLLGTATDSGTVLSEGYAGFRIYSATAANINATFGELTISGTRFYSKPALRGAQKGEYWDGTANIPATSFYDNFNYDDILEYTSVRGTWIVDTTNGKLRDTAGSYGHAIKINNVSVYGGYFRMTTDVGTNRPSLIIGWDGLLESTNYYHPKNGILFAPHSSNSGAYIGGTRVKAFAATSGNGMLNVYWTPLTSTVEWWMDGGTHYTYTDASLNTSYFGVGFWGYNSSATYTYFPDIFINALETTATNGVAVTLGGVNHGARGALWDGTFDGYEYAYMDFTSFPVDEGEFLSCLQCVTTYTGATKYVRDRINNATDSTALSIESNDYASNGAAIIPGSSWGVAGRKRVAFTEEHENDTIRVGAWRDMSAVAIETQPATFICGIHLRKRS